MRPISFLVVITVLVCSWTPAKGQIPHVIVYFDHHLSQAYGNCPAFGSGTLDTLYVVAHNFNMPVAAIEYKIEYSSLLALVFDLVDPAYTATGVSAGGIEVSFPQPLDGSQPILVQRLIVLWQCDDCALTDQPMPVVPHPDSGKIQALRWPDLVYVEAVGMTSTICPSVPVEQTSWGMVKALYQ